MKAAEFELIAAVLELMAAVFELMAAESELMAAVMVECGRLETDHLLPLANYIGSYASQMKHFIS